LIELVMVIVILGVLAAVALPKFVDLKGDAQTAAIQGAAGALASYSTINYAAAAIRGTSGADVVRISSGESAAAKLTASMVGWETAKFAIGTDAACGTLAGSTVAVTLSYVGGTTANTAKATLICTG